MEDYEQKVVEEYIKSKFQNAFTANNITVNDGVEMLLRQYENFKKENVILKAKIFNEIEDNCGNIDELNPLLTHNSILFLIKILSNMATKQIFSSIRSKGVKISGQSTMTKPCAIILYIRTFHEGLLSNKTVNILKRNGDQIDLHFNKKKSPEETLTSLQI